MKKISIILLTFMLFMCYTEMSVAASMQKLSVTLDWFINPDHAPLIIAEQQGYFKEQGLDVTLITPSDPSDPAKWVAASKADIGISYEPEFMQLVDQGLPLIAIGALIDKPLNCLVALKENKINGLAALKGKQIGISNSGLSNLIVDVMLEKQGLSKNDIRLINLQFNLSQALLTRRVDAVAGLQRNVEVPELELKGHGISVFFPEDFGVPTYNELIFITHTKLAHDNRMTRFMVAIKKAIRYLDEHPKEAWQQFAKAYPESNNPVNREAWYATLPYFAEEPAQFHRDEWQTFAGFLQKNKLIGKVQPMARYAVDHAVLEQDEA